MAGAVKAGIIAAQKGVTYVVHGGGMRRRVLGWSKLERSQRRSRYYKVVWETPAL
jgi:hypothetical protein